jgi:hypothetical protein
MTDSPFAGEASIRVFKKWLVSVAAPAPAKGRKVIVQSKG